MGTYVGCLSSNVAGMCVMQDHSSCTWGVLHVVLVGDVFAAEQDAGVALGRHLFAAAPAYGFREQCARLQHANLRCQCNFQDARDSLFGFVRNLHITARTPQASAYCDVVMLRLLIAASRPDACTLFIQSLVA